MPFEAYVYAARVRAAAEGRQPQGTPRARVRTRTGVWLLMHGSMLEGTDQLALIIEPAKAADVAPLIVEAYGFSQRELEVTRLIASGLGTSEIAAKLFLSPHTVRDHVKAVFEKVGVSSRGELVAKVFADHYAPVPHDEASSARATDPRAPPGTRRSPRRRTGCRRGAAARRPPASADTARR